MWRAVTHQTWTATINGRKFFDFGFGNATGFYDVIERFDPPPGDDDSVSTGPTSSVYSSSSLEIKGGYSTEIFTDRALEVKEEFLLFCVVVGIVVVVVVVVPDLAGARSLLFLLCSKDKDLDVRTRCCPRFVCSASIALILLRMFLVSSEHALNNSPPRLACGLFLRPIDAVRPLSLCREDAPPPLQDIPAIILSWNPQQADPLRDTKVASTVQSNTFFPSCFLSLVRHR